MATYNGYYRGNDTVDTRTHRIMIIQGPDNGVVLHLLLRCLLGQNLSRGGALSQHPLYIQNLDTTGTWITVILILGVPTQKR